MYINQLRARKYFTFWHGYYMCGCNSTSFLILRKGDDVIYLN